jgi:hypothetical protein
MMELEAEARLRKNGFLIRRSGVRVTPGAHPRNMIRDQWTVNRSRDSQISNRLSHSAVRDRATTSFAINHHRNRIMCHRHE